MKKYKNQAFTILVASGHFFLNGMSLGWMAPSVTRLQDPGQVLAEPIKYWQISLLSAMSFSGIWIMGLAGTICNRYGRKPVLVIGAVTRAVAWMIIGLSTDIPILCFGKVLEAHVAGIVYPTSIIYMSEIASVNIRGFALTLTGVFSNVGILTMYVFGPFLSYMNLCLIPFGFSIVVALLSCGIAESPMYFMMRGKTDAANRSLKFLNRDPEASFHGDTTKAMIKRKEEHRLTNAQRLKELFFIKRNLKAFSLTCFINIMQQLSGIVAVLFQMTSIFELAGSSVPPYLATIAVGGIQVISCLSASLLVEKAGRRPLLLASCFATALANVALGFNFYLAHIKSPITESISWLPLTSLAIFTIFYWHGLGVMPSTLTGELLDDHVRSLGSSIICTVEIISTIVVVSTFDILNSCFGSHCTFWFFGACCAVTFIVVALFLPETKGKSSEEIQKMFT